MFADDFVGVSDSREYCNKWRLKANVSKNAVMVFSLEHSCLNPVI